MRMLLTLLSTGLMAYNVAATGYKTIKIQELQSPPGPRHSAGIVYVPPDGELADGAAIGLIYFSNELAVPDTGGFDGGEIMGLQTGHCVEVHIGKDLACYFRFDIDADEGKGVINAEALFDLSNFPNADLTITGGTGDFTGIVGSGYTSAPDDFDGTTFFYNFNYLILGADDEEDDPTPKVTKFVLVNADTDSDIGYVTDGMILPATDFAINIRAEVANEDAVESVVFKVDGAEVRTENESEYLIGGNIDDDYWPWDLPSAGVHFITAVPYPESDGEGAAGESLTVSVTVV